MSTEASPCESLFDTQNALAEQMTKFISNVKKTATSKRTHGFYVSRVNGWHDLWQQFAANDLKINKIKTAENARSAYFTEDLFSCQEQIYYEFKGELIDNVSKCEKLANMPETHKDGNVTLLEGKTSISGKSGTSHTSLPRISLPKFSGNYNDWISFRDLYLSVIHQNADLEDVQKFHYLKTTLTGDAANVIKQFSVTNVNYSSAWKALTERYENTRVLVFSLLRTFTSQQKISTESANAIKGLIDVTSECLASLENLSINISHWDPLVIHILIQKLPPEAHKAWEESIGDSYDVPTWQIFKKFLETRFRTLEAIGSNKLKEKRGDTASINGKNPIQNFYNSNSSCELCSEMHSIRSCEKFLKLDVKSRLKFAKSKRYCLNCLGKYHSFNKCLSKSRCNVCKKRHHTLLHLPVNTLQNISANQVGAESKAIDSKNIRVQPLIHNLGATTSNVLTHFTNERRQVLLATAIVFIKTRQGLQSARALIDPGSQATFITNAALQRMKIKTTSTTVRITGLAKAETASSRKMAQIVIQARNTDTNIEVNAIVLDQLTELLPSTQVEVQKWDHLQGLNLADPTFNTPGKIDILIGADIYPSILLDGLKRGPNGSPAAQNTIFGWILSGTVDNRNTTNKVEVVSYINTLEDLFDLKKFWEVEECPPSHTNTPEDDFCEKYFLEHHHRKHDGSYVVRLPFKALFENHEVTLGSSRHIAFRRLINTEKSTEKKGMLQSYNEVLKEYLTLNHMEEINSDVVGGGNYLPHHAVLKETSTTTKLRVVFDASCKTDSGISLNESLLTGPALQQDITTLLLNWRFHKYVFSADIEKMYRQIWIHHDDADYQRILWRPKPKQAIKDYRLLTVTFGVSCAPYLAIRTLHQLAEDEKSIFPNAAECLKNDFYVDDVLAGRDSIEEVNTLKHELKALLNKGKFPLRKFSANHKDILTDLPKEEISTEALLQLQENPSIKALGLSWHPQEDMFRYKLNIDLAGPLTKRQILSKIAKLFDPLGWLSPIIISGKILIQKLWLAKVEWDAVIPDSLKQEWYNFAETLKSIENIKIPRWINCLSSTKIEFHGFCDSSEQAYAAVIYVRVQQDDGLIDTYLLLSKTRVAPVKSLSLPRLELCGAHLLSKLVRKLRDNLRRTAPVCLWTDSTIVLTWLANHPNRWKTFVANRISDIHNNFPENIWRHVRSEHNPADLASRGVSKADLTSISLWWEGPAWLRKPATEWPQIANLEPSKLAEDEMKRIRTFQVSVGSEDIIHRFSNFNRACRVVAYCRRFWKRNRSPYLTTEEILEAKLALIRLSQSQHYPDEIISLRKGENINKKSILLSLNPFLDEQEVLRVGGRLEHANLSFEEKHPIILACSSILSRLLVEHIHRATMHGGPNIMLTTLRKTYWIPRVKSVIRSQWHRCVTCTRWRQQPATQIMGNLPKNRIQLTRPFAAVGIDFAGPISIKLNKLRNAKLAKAYLAVFVCFATKALHIEAVSDLTSEAFLAALRRFFARRGVSKDIYTDNGTNFVGAARTLDKELEAALKKNVLIAAEEYANHTVNWHFIPPAAPNFGGLWEAGVKSIKYHLRRVIGQSALTFEELATILTQIEAILNSRPLCPLTDNPEDFSPLTPAHFLIGKASSSIPETDWNLVQSSHLSRWQYLQKLKCDFWNRWQAEYLHRLQQRSKWKIEEPPIRIGTLVLIKEENLPPSAWKLARVIELHSGRDGKVRVVTVKTSTNQLKRSISKICCLPFEN